MSPGRYYAAGGKPAISQLSVSCPRDPDRDACGRSARSRPDWRCLDGDRTGWWAGAVSIATYFGVSDLVIGLTVVAIGTSLPELATSALAALRGQRDIAVGNVVGSNIFNILVVLGLTASCRADGHPHTPAGFDGRSADHAGGLPGLPAHLPGRTPHLPAGKEGCFSATLSPISFSPFSIPCTIRKWDYLCKP